jgi:hypothetical protein
VSAVGAWFVSYGEVGVRVDVAEVAPGVHHARAKHVSWVLVTEGHEVTLIDSG